MKNLKSFAKLRAIRIVLMVSTFSCIFTALLVIKRLGILSWELGGRVELLLNIYKNVRISVPMSPLNNFS